MKVRVDAATEYTLVGEASALVEAVRAPGENERARMLQNRIVPAVWIPVVRHVIHADLSGARWRDVFDPEKHSVERVVERVYPMFGKEGELVQYYAASEDRVLNRITSISDRERDATLVDVNMLGTPRSGDPSIPLKFNPMVAAVHGSTLPTDKGTGLPTREALVYGYNAMARSILAGSAKERPSLFVGANKTRDGKYMGSLAKPHPVVGEIASWMTGQASAEKPAALYRWIKMSVLSNDREGDADQDVLDGVVRDVLGVSGVMERWYPDRTDVESNIVLKEWGRKMPPVEAGTVTIVKSISVDQFTYALLDRFRPDLDPSVYANIQEANRSALTQILDGVTPPDDVLTDVTIPRDDVPLVEYNATLIEQIVDALGFWNAELARKNALAVQVAVLSTRGVKQRFVSSRIEEETATSYDPKLAHGKGAAVLPTTHHDAVVRQRHNHSSLAHKHALDVHTTTMTQFHLAPSSAELACY